MTNDGREAGFNDGRTEGERVLLRRLLTRRFGPLTREVATRLDAATAAELERWGDRLLDAATLADVFATP